MSIDNDRTRVQTQTAEELSSFARDVQALFEQAGVSALILKTLNDEIHLLATFRTDSRALNRGNAHFILHHPHFDYPLNVYSRVARSTALGSPDVFGVNEYALEVEFVILKGAEGVESSQEINLIKTIEIVCSQCGTPFTPKEYSKEGDIYQIYCPTCFSLFNLGLDISLAQENDDFNLNRFIRDKAHIVQYMTQNYDQILHLSRQGQSFSGLPFDYVFERDKKERNGFVITSSPLLEQSDKERDALREMFISFLNTALMGIFHPDGATLLQDVLPESLSADSTIADDELTIANEERTFSKIRKVAQVVAEKDVSLDEESQITVSEIVEDKETNRVRLYPWSGVWGVFTHRPVVKLSAAVTVMVGIAIGVLFVFPGGEQREHSSNQVALTPIPIQSAPVQEPAPQELELAVERVEDSGQDAIALTEKSPDAPDMNELASEIEAQKQVLRDRMKKIEAQQDPKVGLAAQATNIQTDSSHEGRLQPENKVSKRSDPEVETGSQPVDSKGSLKASSPSSSNKKDEARSVSRKASKKRAAQETARKRLIEKKRAASAARARKLAAQKKAAKHAEASDRDSLKKEFTVAKRIFEDGDADKALAVLNRIVRKDKNFPDVHKVLGNVYAAKENYRSAVNEYSRYLVLAPHAEDASDIRAIIEFYQSQLE